MKIHKSYKYRIYPNKEQIQYLSQSFGCVRFVYNYFLQQRISYYAENSKGLSYNDNSAALTQLKKQEEYSWLRDVNSQSIQSALRNLDVAYNNFFNKRSKFPKFKKKSNRQTFSVPQNFVIKDGKLNIPKCNGIKIKLHREIIGKMLSVTLSRTPSNKYFASVLCELDIPEPEYKGDVIGIDFGIKTFITTSDGIKVDPPKYYRKSESKLKRLHKQVSKKQNNSKNKYQANKILAKAYEKVVNQRTDFLHKLSKQLTNDNQVIYIEDLAIKHMIRNHKLAKSFADAGWHQFVSQLQYKGNWYGCTISKIDRWFPSSKRCLLCGYINDNLTLKDRSWTCPRCTAPHDRDLNAANNILLFGRAGTALTAISKVDIEKACGEDKISLPGTGIRIPFKKQEALVFRQE